MKRITWFNLVETAAGHYSPMVTLTLGLNGQTSQKFDFLVDSGASRSLMPRRHVSRLLQGQLVPPETDTALQDASGKRLQGVEIDLDVRVVGSNQLPIIRERFVVGSGIRWAVLGTTWFEKMGVHFRNFPHTPQGRRFALYAGPDPLDS